MPRHVQWTFPGLMYQTRRENPLVYKGLTRGLHRRIIKAITLTIMVNVLKFWTLVKSA